MTPKLAELFDRFFTCLMRYTAPSDPIWHVIQELKAELSMFPPVTCDHGINVKKACNKCSAVENIQTLTKPPYETI